MTKIVGCKKAKQTTAKSLHENVRESLYGTGECRGLDARFLAAMLSKLQSGRDKGRVGWDRHWKDCTLATADECSPPWFLKRIAEELIELAAAVEREDSSKILFECADVANLAMMLADVTRSVSRQAISEIDH